MQAGPSFGSVQPGCSRSAVAQVQRACRRLWDPLKASGCFSSIAPEVGQVWACRSARLGMAIMACVRLMSDGWAEPVADGHGYSLGWMLKLSIQEALELPLASQTNSLTAEWLPVSHRS